MKHKSRLLLSLSLLTFALVAAAFTHPAAAYASARTQIVSRPHIFWTKGHTPSSGAVHNLLYHGGPVVTSTLKAYAIFWEPENAFVGAKYNSLLKRFFSDIGDSPLYENNEQYTDTTGGFPSDVVLAGTWTDRTPYPGTFLLDSVIQDEVALAMKANDWKPSIHHAFFVFTALNEFICTEPKLSACSAPYGDFCAYHSAFGNVANPVLYGAMPFDGNFLRGCYGLGTSPNHDANADAEISTTSHELIEVATDPLGSDPKLAAWYDVDGNEIGDKCAYVYGPLNKKGANVSWNGHPYIVQSEWDNKASGCVLQGP